jgi:hypothetical protein
MKFEINDTVKAEITAQGMIAGNLYTVTKQISDHTPFGTFVNYQITDGVKVLNIGNGHLLLSKVGA